MCSKVLPLYLTSGHLKESMHNSQSLDLTERYDPVLFPKWSTEQMTNPLLIQPEFSFYGWPGKDLLLSWGSPSTRF